MKPWLHDILACPICKHYPLNLIVFSYENDDIFFKELIDDYFRKDLDFHINNKIPELFKEKNQIYYIRDNIIIEKTSINIYLDLIKSSLEEMNYVKDNTLFTYSKKCLNLTKKEVKNKLIEFSNEQNQQKINKIYPELNFINKLKIETEIKDGLLFCSKCERWYPIIDSIPHMLPDKYRNKEDDIEFLKIHQKSLDPEFLNKNLKPFNL
ncbi:MAG: hypothetical protein JXA99_14570 [Candidatus Lokiarchaeota archaeon]|nr:hypothetical protein [Candidatus Lokiarchaeota archaeon]